MIINVHQLEATLANIVQHYDDVEPAPSVSAWANDLYIRVSESPEKVSLIEILQVDRIWNDREGYMSPSYAANTVFKLMNRLGHDVTGMPSRTEDYGARDGSLPSQRPKPKNARGKDLRSGQGLGPFLFRNAKYFCSQ